jgi:hypothetical protein
MGMNNPAPITHGITSAMADETLGRLAAADLVDHPGERGRARENIIRDFLTELVPRGFGASSGFIVDASGAQSRQQDIIIFRREYHPVFAVGSVEFFPVEAVAAVLEIKSSLNASETRAAVTNAVSVKGLDRTNSGQNYLVAGGAGGKHAGDVNPEMHEHQVFSGIIAAKSDVSAEAIAGTFRDSLREEPRRNWPNLISVAGAWTLSYDPSPEHDAPRSNQMFGRRLRIAHKAQNDNVEPLLDAAEQLWSFLRVTPLIDVSPSAYVHGSWWSESFLPLPGEE